MSLWALANNPKGEPKQIRANNTRQGKSLESLNELNERYTMYTYSQDRHYDKWETLADNFDVLKDELDTDDSDLFLDVDDFDLDEVL